MGSNPTRDDTLCHLCKVRRATGCIFLKRELSFIKQKYYCYYNKVLLRSIRNVRFFSLLTLPLFDDVILYYIVTRLKRRLQQVTNFNRFTTDCHAWLHRLVLVWRSFATSSAYQSPLLDIVLSKYMLLESILCFSYLLLVQLY